MAFNPTPIKHLNKKIYCACNLFKKRVVIAYKYTTLVLEKINY